MAPEADKLDNGTRSLINATGVRMADIVGQAEVDGGGRLRRGDTIIAAHETRDRQRTGVARYALISEDYIPYEADGDLALQKERWLRDYVTHAFPRETFTEIEVVEFDPRGTDVDVDELDMGLEEWNDYVTAEGTEGESARVSAYGVVDARRQMTLVTSQSSMETPGTQQVPDVVAQFQEQGMDWRIPRDTAGVRARVINEYEAARLAEEPPTVERDTPGWMADMEMQRAVAEKSPYERVAVAADLLGQETKNDPMHSNERGQMLGALVNSSEGVRAGVALIAARDADRREALETVTMRAPDGDYAAMATTVAQARLGAGKVDNTTAAHIEGAQAVQNRQVNPDESIRQDLHVVAAYAGTDEAPDWFDKENVQRDVATNLQRCFDRDSAAWTKQHHVNLARPEGSRETVRDVPPAHVTAGPSASGPGLGIG